MNTKQLSILLLLGLVLGGAGLYVRRNQQGQYNPQGAKMGQKLLGDFDLNGVATVRLSKGTNVLSVGRKDDEWTVDQRGGYPANTSEIADFIKKMWEMKIVQPVTAGPSRHGLLELTKDLATQVEFLDASGKSLKSFLLGKKHVRGGGDGDAGGGGWGDGRYVMVGSDIALIGDGLNNIEIKPEAWIAKDFFKVEKPVSVEIQASVETNSFSLVRTNEFADWNLVNPRGEEKLDSSKVGSFSSILTGPSFNDIVLNPDATALGLDKPTRALIKTADRFTYTVSLGRAQDGDNYPLRVEISADLIKERTPGKDEKPEDKARLDKEFADKLSKQQEKLKTEQGYSKWTYTVSKWTVDSLLKERSSLMVGPKDEAKSGESTPSLPRLPPGGVVPAPELEAE